MARRRHRLRNAIVLASLAGAGVWWWRQASRAPEPDQAAPPEWPPLPETPPPAEEPRSSEKSSKPVNGTTVPEQSAPAASWVDPHEGACPEGYPVKVARSGVYHMPGGSFYERTVPDRCYATPAAAEADGYRASKR